MRTKNYKGKLLMLKKGLKTSVSDVVSDKITRGDIDSLRLESMEMDNQLRKCSSYKKGSGLGCLLMSIFYTYTFLYFYAWH